MSSVRTHAGAHISIPDRSADRPPRFDPPALGAAPPTADGSTRGLRLAFGLQLRAGLSSQPVEINCFGRHAQSPVAVVAAATARLANTPPGRGLITGPPKTSTPHKPLLPIHPASNFF